MNDPTELSKQDFNTIFFPRCNDQMFKVAIMFLKFNPFPLHSQKFLFFADKDAVVSNFNLLSFTDTYNETHKYLKNIIENLQFVQDENSWYVTRSKIYTRFSMFTSLNFDSIAQNFPHASPEVNNVVKELKTASILWNNAIHYVSDKNSKYYPQQTEQIWDLWKNLTCYHQKNIDDITPKKELVQEFEKSIHHRLNHEFFKKYKLHYEKGSSEIQSIHIVHEALNTIMLKNDIEQSFSDTFINKVKKVLKI